MKTDNEIMAWAKLYAESVKNEHINEEVNDHDIINTVFSTLLCFMVGEGDKVLKDSEWMNILRNDIAVAVQRKVFIPKADDKARIEKLDQDYLEI